VINISAESWREIRRTVQAAGWCILGSLLLLIGATVVISVSILAANSVQVAEALSR